MNVWLNIPANSKLISLLNLREKFLDDLSSGDIDLFFGALAGVPGVESAIVSELHQLASDANLLAGGVK